MKGKNFGLYVGMISILLIVCGICVFFSIEETKYHKSEFEVILTQNDNCWTFYSEPDSQINNKNVRIVGCTKFYENGRFSNFFVDREPLGEIRSIDKGGFEEGADWSFDEKKAFLWIGESKMKIIRYSKDTIVWVAESDDIQKMVRRQ